MRVVGLVAFSLCALLQNAALADEPPSAPRADCPQVACPPPVIVVPPPVVVVPNPNPQAPPTILVPGPTVVVPDDAPPPPPALTIQNDRPGYRLESWRRPRWSVFGAGLGSFVLAWLIPAALGSEAGYQNLWIPIAGPIMAMRDCGGFACPMADEYLAIALVYQVAGAVATIVGLATRENAHRWVITPTKNGLALAGRF